MKRTFLGLLLAAIGVWGYVVFRIIMTLIGGGDSGSPGLVAGAPAIAMLSRSRAVLDTAFRDPFQSYLYAQKPAPVAPKAGKVPVVAKVIDPPKAILSGILWGDEPVAILKQDGQTELVKKGAAVWDLKVLKIEKNQVVVQKQGRQFTLAY